MEFYNPNIAGEMAQLLIKNQNKYVPSCGNGESKKIITPIPFHGDQLFEERARNVIWTFQDGDNEFDRIKGLNPEFADWHGKVNLYEVCFFLETIFVFPVLIYSCLEMYLSTNTFSLMRNLFGIRVR